MKTLLQFIFQIFFMAISFSQPKIVFAENIINVTATPKINSHQEVEILFSLENKTKNPIYILNSELPWMDSSGLVLIITDLTGSPLKQVIPIADPNFEDIVQIKPNTSLTGSIVLNFRFPSLNVDRKKRELIVFWSYKSTPFFSSLSKLERVGGYFSLGTKSDIK